MTSIGHPQAGQLCRDCKGTGRIEHEAWEHAIWEGEPIPRTVQKDMLCINCDGMGSVGRAPGTEG